jgi:hypothetical protein
MVFPYYGTGFPIPLFNGEEGGDKKKEKETKKQ